MYKYQTPRKAREFLSLAIYIGFLPDGEGRGAGQEKTTESIAPSLPLKRKRVFAEQLSSAKTLYSMVPRARLELARAQGPRDFKSLVSTNSTTKAEEGFLT